jgi:hypothetical protein
VSILDSLFHSRTDDDAEGLSHRKGKLGIMFDLDLLQGETIQSERNSLTTVVAGMFMEGQLLLSILLNDVPLDDEAVS